MIADCQMLLGVKYQSFASCPASNEYLRRHQKDGLEIGGVKTSEIFKAKSLEETGEDGSDDTQFIGFSFNLDG